MVVRRTGWTGVALCALACGGTTGPGGPLRPYRMGFSAIPPRADQAVLLQARYLGRQAHLLDSARAIGLFQLTFADLDLSAIPLPPGSILPLFAHLGVVDSALGANLALATWDSILARRLLP